MSASVDLRRTVLLRIVDDIDTSNGQPGDVEVHAMEGRVWGYGYRCAGCGERSYLAIDPEQPHPRWTVTEGDVERPDTVTLSPSILHSTALGGCGWHGYLTRGVFTPC